MSVDDIKQLAAAGATEITVKPDGTIIARFDKPAPVQVVPMPYPAYPVQPPWGQPYTITWRSADNQLPALGVEVAAFNHTWLSASEVPNG